MYKKKDLLQFSLILLFYYKFTIQNGSLMDFIEGKIYQRLQIFSSQGTQSINYIGNLLGNPNEQLIIIQYNSILNDETEVLKQIKRQQNEIQPRCQHIIKILGIQDQTQSKLLIVMEKAKGNILDLINSYKSLSFVQKIRIFELVKILYFKNGKRSYFHRDLKPENFVYYENKNKDYKVKLIDFGLAIKDSTIYATELVGTLNYMAPEVMVAKEIYVKTDDIWSFGIILYELLTSQKILQAKNEKEFKQQMFQLSQEQIDNKINKVDDIEQQEMKLINQILQKDSKKRIKLEMLLLKIYEYFHKIKQQEEENLLELQQIRQSSINKLELFKSIIVIFIQNLNQRLEIVNNIQDNNLIMEKIMKQNILLEQQIMKEKEEQLKIQQEQLLKKEQEEEFKKRVRKISIFIFNCQIIVKFINYSDQNNFRRNQLLSKNLKIYFRRRVDFICDNIALNNNIRNLRVRIIGQDKIVI
ncbi:unnamed protein product [Paramecium pentaurelia]|uniref:Protein kinase domain-containing protein n=1 Tax=Paramecium pentaurelia TaxID=43138 RepID=A0A8S1TX60_9CILI|nr:unnamed protein product [Paramecium pentaurelia]